MNIAVLLSGGVDSSVALNLLHATGQHALTAFYLKIWLEDELAGLGHCPWEEDLHYVREVCRSHNIPLEVVPLQAAYHAQIVDFAIQELAAGRTPSPDILCNSRIKFGAFLDHIGSRFDKVATGHYARVEAHADGYRLLRAPDAVKDQTYFLSRLRQDQLARAVFPIGHLEKHAVRALAASLQLPNRDRPDSQGICFLGKIKFPDFVRFHLGQRAGDIVDAQSGEVLGKHAGYWFYTIGQRQGIGLSGGPWYVVGKDIEENRIRVARAPELANRTRHSFMVDDVHWISPPPPSGSVTMRVRHGPQLTHAKLSSAEHGRMQVDMDVPDTGIAPGQSAVFYDGEVCLGAGTIL